MAHSRTGPCASSIFIHFLGGFATSASSVAAGTTASSEYRTVSNASSTLLFHTLGMPVCPGPTGSMYCTSWYRYTMGPTGVGMWHPRLEACPRSERHEEVTTRHRCPCHRAKWWRALQALSLPWRLHGGMTLRIISRVPKSRTCIPEEGEGTHDWAAIPADHVHVPAALQAVEFR